MLLLLLTHAYSWLLGSTLLAATARAQATVGDGCQLQTNKRTNYRYRANRRVSRFAGG